MTKLRIVKLRAVDLLYWAIVWTGAIIVAMVLSFFIGEPLMPFAYVWLGGLTFAEMVWICEFAIPYWLENRKKRKDKGQ